MSPKFHNWEEILAYLEAKGLFHMDLSLSRIKQPLAKLGLIRPNFKVVQILGTNGKGSTASFLASLCEQHGLKTGLYTSPHFVSPTERIKINSKEIEGEEWLDLATFVASEAPDLTYFEFLTVLALALFKEKKVEVAVLEAGLGGAHDATTAIQCDLMLYTPIALDHKAILGPTIKDIAIDKALAMRKVPVCTAPQFPQVFKCLKERSLDVGARLQEIEPLEASYKKSLGLLGAHQELNAALALAGFKILASLLGLKVDRAKLLKGLAQTFIPGRMQWVAKSNHYPSLMLDGAHNPHGMQTLLASLKNFSQPKALIFACLQDKDWPQVLGLLDYNYKESLIAYFPSLYNSRASEALVVAKRWQGRVGLEDSFNLKELLEKLAKSYQDPKDYVLVTGSLYLLAEVYKIYPELLNPKTISA
ncbi:MAG: bifunctional folylpolyglutamate synthase/ dihydrofolate synthase [Desulfovibrionaceae bacterium]|nr:bifunctional folylpolyglutamate synthase/ dihydrofolate synthase [Desulfovibrionaceae bacterium]